MSIELELNYLNLHDYKFRTLTLPSDDDSINEFFEELNPNGLYDVELQWTELEISTKANYNYLCLSQLKELSEIDDLREFDMIFYACNDFNEALEIYNDGMYMIYDDCKNDSDLGYYIATQCGYVDEQKDDILHRYFDYEKFGQDCRFEGNFTQYDYDTVIEIHC